MTDGGHILYKTKRNEETFCWPLIYYSLKSLVQTDHIFWRDDTDTECERTGKYILLNVKQWYKDVVL
jgi:hypothetical protein